jgi:tRNA G18 (ribose-2'-O)-methylase SpoU
MKIAISDPDDSRIEAYRAVRERDLVGRQHRFVAEGEVVLRVLLNQSRFEIESVLLAESRLDGLGDIPIHRGVLAIARRAPLEPVESLLSRLPEQALVVGLIGLANHDNVGGIFRNAAAFGVRAVLLDRETCDPLYRKAIRVSVGGALVVPFTRVPSAEAMVQALEAASFEVIALSPSGQDVLSDIRPARRTALLLGAEGPGLPQEVLARTRTVSIPMSGGFDSLNVATTSGIALHHLAFTGSRQ